MQKAIDKILLKSLCLTDATAINILTKMLDSKVSETLEELTIYFDDQSNDYRPDKNYYVELTKVLSRFDFPNLKSFHYGYEDHYGSGYTPVSYLGDITSVLKSMPKLETLYLIGSCFKLSDSLHLRHLQDIYIDWYLTNTNVLNTKETIDYLLNSNYQDLKKFVINVDDITEEHENYCSYIVFSVPDTFYKTLEIVNLTRFEISGMFSKGTKKKLEMSLKNSRAKVFIEIEEYSFDVT